MITVHTGYRTPANGCLAQAGDGLCPYPATHKVTIWTVEASYDSFVCSAHELVLADEGRLAGSTPIGGAK